MQDQKLPPLHNGAWRVISHAHMKRDLSHCSPTTVEDKIQVVAHPGHKTIRGDSSECPRREGISVR